LIRNCDQTFFCALKKFRNRDLRREGSLHALRRQCRRRKPAPIRAAIAKLKAEKATGGRRAFFDP
jgi:hypothetical protein